MKLKFQKLLKDLYHSSFQIELTLHQWSFRTISICFDVVVLAPIKFLMKCADCELNKETK